MNGEITKSDQALINSIKELDGTYQVVTGKFDKMRSTITQLRTDGWHGNGSAKFEEAVANFEMQAKKVTSVMVTFSEQLGEAEKTYDVTEEQVEAAFNRHAGGLGG